MRPQASHYYDVLLSIFSDTDYCLSLLLNYIDKIRGKTFKNNTSSQKRVNLTVFLPTRDSINPLETQVTNVVSWYNNANKLLLKALSNTINQADASSLWR